MPVVPLSQLKADKENVRPARGQRASLEADQAVADRVQVALEELKSLGDSGDGVKYAEFFGEQLRKMSAEIGALKKDRDVAVKKPCVLLRPELKRDFFDVRRVQCREQLWLYLEDANRQRCSKKIRKDQSLPELSMQSMWQLNWGNEVATEQKRSE